MSNLGIFLLIVLVLAIIVGNILLLKKSAKFEIKRKDEEHKKDEGNKSNQ